MNVTKDSDDISDEEGATAREESFESGEGTEKAAPRPSGSCDDALTGRRIRKGTSRRGAVAGEQFQERTRGCDDTFDEFQRVCREIADNSSYLKKTAVVRRLFIDKCNKDSCVDDVVLWCRLLLPGAFKRVYNLQSKALIKLFARILGQDKGAMLEDLEQGDVAQTIKTFYRRNTAMRINKKSDLTLAEVNEFLDKLSTLTKEEEQICHLSCITRRCTAEDLEMIVRLIMHDLRINAGPKHVLEAIDEDAYRTFQHSRDLPYIVGSCLHKLTGSPGSGPGASAPVKSPKKSGRVASLKLMTPVQPMLAKVCKSVTEPLEKCPSGMWAEVKYDGERVQVHKIGSTYRFFSRSLKQIPAHKVDFIEEYMPRAFPEGDSLILDGEIILADINSGLPHPFGTIGIHERAKVQDAEICFIIFDIIFYNDESLIDRPLRDRKKLLQEKMKPIFPRIILSDSQYVVSSSQLLKRLQTILDLQLEGLVLKSNDSKYEPGKRNWLKIKKDYLYNGNIADSVDLVVLGAWYGTGNKGGIMSVFLMGCYDPDSMTWKTVTKVHGGIDDAKLTELQDSLDMVKISKDPNLVPEWLIVKKPMIPDFVARDPKKHPVWEITGAQFSNKGTHTANGISIRFPRVTCFRDDKDWKTATNLSELQTLFDNTKNNVDLSVILPSDDRQTLEVDKLNQGVKMKCINDSDSEKSPSPKKKREAKSVRRLEDNNKTTGLNMRFDELDDQESIEARDETPIKKSPEKLSAKSREKKRKIREERESDPKSSQRSDEGHRAEYYSFIGMDYIEYSASGRPLNWVNGRKPPKFLPEDAKPISEPIDSKMKSRFLLPNMRFCFANDLDHEKRKVATRTLKTLGGVILSEAEQRQATHVIHGCAQTSSATLLEPTDVPKTARHLQDSWVLETAENSKVASTLSHAVSLAAAYCSCPCPHAD